MKFLFDNFDILAESPGGIKKLREMILQFAVQGKLVSQDPNDEPASVLLAKIRVEKERLIEEGRIRKQKLLEPIRESEILFNMPIGWDFVRLDIYGNWKAGSTPSRNNSLYYGGEIPWVKSGEVKQGIIKITSETITNTALEQCSLDINPVGAVLIAMYGANIGEVGILDIPATTNQAVCACTTYSMIEELFLKLLLISWKSNFISQGAGAAQPNISRIKIVNTVVPLPPLAEQKRIVAKVDSLMALCDELEKQQKEKALKKLTLNKASLHTLHNSTTKQDFTKNWNHITNNFDLLYRIPENVKELKQTILQLAVQGKLVPQDPNDEPASVLLEKIKVEKELLVEEGKIKKQKPLEPIKADEIPFELPEGWEWARFGKLVNINVQLVKATEYPTYEQIAPDSIEKGTGKLIKRRTVLESGVLGPNSRFYSGQVLYSKIRPSLSKAVFVEFDGLCSADMYPLDSFIDHFFLLKLILSNVFLAQVIIAENRVKMPKLNIISLTNFLIPLPPLAEQKRIVAKVDSLMVLCDQLGENLSDKEKMSGKMLSAVVSGL